MKVSLLVLLLIVYAICICNATYYGYDVTDDERRWLFPKVTVVFTIVSASHIKEKRKRSKRFKFRSILYIHTYIYVCHHWVFVLHSDEITDNFIHWKMKVLHT